jgi:hypothetical protein
MDLQIGPTRLLRAYQRSDIHLRCIQDSIRGLLQRGGEDDRISKQDDGCLPLFDLCNPLYLDRYKSRRSRLPVLPHCCCQAMYALVRRFEPSIAIGKEFEVGIAGIMDNGSSFAHLPNILGQGLEGWYFQRVLQVILPMRVKVDALRAYIGPRVQPSSETCEKSIRTTNACVHTSDGVYLIADSRGNRREIRVVRDHACRYRTF